MRTVEQSSARRLKARDYIDMIVIVLRCSGLLGGAGCKYRDLIAIEQLIGHVGDRRVEALKLGLEVHVSVRGNPLERGCCPIAIQNIVTRDLVWMSGVASPSPQGPS
jgi:hypothetical protein